MVVGRSFWPPQQLRWPLLASSLELRRLSATRQRHRKFVMMHDAWRGLRFRPTVLNLGPPQVAGEVATHQGRHRQLGMHLLLHQWTSTSLILGMNYCSCSVELLVLITNAMNLF
jgi:hypothetical protein